MVFDSPHAVCLFGRSAAVSIPAVNPAVATTKDNMIIHHFAAFSCQIHKSDLRLDFLDRI